MDVTKVNYDLIVDEFIRLLNECEFYAIDQEMTGISFQGNDDNYGMTLEESYKAKRLVAERYLAFQYGVCLFTPKKDSPGTYEARPFNFWLRAGADGEDCTMSMSALEFHVKNKLSLQKWMNEGIPFVHRHKEAAEKLKLFPEDSSDKLNEEESKWVQEQLDYLAVTVSEIKENLEELAEKKAKRAAAEEERKANPPKEADQEEGDAAPPAEEKLPTEDSIRTFKTEGLAHISTDADVALYYAMEKKGYTILADPPLDGGCPIWKRLSTTWTVVDTEKYAAKKAADSTRRTNILNRRIGFRRAWNALVECRKPHLGHNYFTDILFEMHIHDAPLAPTLEEHRSRVQSCFPTIVDTKILLNQITDEMTPFAKTALEPAMEESERRVQKLADQSRVYKTVLPLGFEKYHKSARTIADAVNSDSACAHHAAFDAYMTGVLYLNLKSIYGVEWIEKWTNHVAIFGSCYIWKTDDAAALELNVHGEPFHLSFPDGLRRPDLEPLFLTEEKRAEYEERETLIREAKLAGKFGKDVPKGLETGMYFGWLGDTEVVVATKLTCPPAEILERINANKKSYPESSPLQQVVVTYLPEWNAQRAGERESKRQRIE